jgi:Domain of unknown function (DUF5666)
MWKKIAIVGAAGAVIVGGGAAAVAAASTDTPGTGTSASPSPSSSASTPAKSAQHGKGDRARKVLGRFEHAEWVSKDGTANVTHDAVHGTVKSVSPTSITVQASDGFSLTFTVNSDTKVRVRDASSTPRPKGKAGTISEVKAGDTVLVSGVKSGGTVDAKHVVDGLAK